MIRPCFHLDEHTSTKSAFTTQTMLSNSTQQFESNYMQNSKITCNIYTGK